MVGVMILTALAMDLAAEWRAYGRLGELVPLLRDQRVWLADAVAAALAEHGVPAFVRSANYRQLVWWGGPQAPVAVMVPAARLADAEELLATWEGAKAPTEGAG